MLRHGRGTAAIAQHHTHVLKVQIPHQRPVMGLQRLKGPVVAVPGYSKQSGLHMLPLDGAVKGTEAVDHFFQLGRHAIVVKRRGKHQHIRFQDLFSYGLHIILLYAGTFITAVDAPDTGVDICVGHIDQLHGMACPLGPLAKAVRQDMGGALFIGAALQNKDLHSIASLLHFLFPVADHIKLHLPGKLPCHKRRLYPTG